MNLMQPFVQKNGIGYESIKAVSDGIFEFYSFREEASAIPVNAVPDGCVDLLYGIGEKDVCCSIGGTVLKMKYWPLDENRTYFGIRFRPGQCPLPKGLCIDDIINTDIEIPMNAYGMDISEQLYTAENLKARADIVSDMLTKTGADRESIDVSEKIESYIRRRIYDTHGRVSIREISAETGYSECYVRRAFHKMHGISPKTFEKIVRFQNTLEQMTKQPCAASDLAIEGGYYDQSHMVKEFKMFTGLTPENYIRYMSDVKED